MGTEPGRERAGEEPRNPFRGRSDEHSGKSQGLRRGARISALRSLRKSARRSCNRRGRPRDAAQPARRADHRRRKDAQARVRREAVRALLAGCKSRGTRLRREEADARDRVQLALPARASGNEANARRRRAAREAPAHGGKFLRPERVPLRARALAPEPRGRPRGRHDRTGRAPGRRHDPSLGEDRVGGRAELARSPGVRPRRHDLDAVPLPERRDRLSRHRDRHRGNLAPAGLRRERLGRGRRRRAPRHLATRSLHHRPGEPAPAPQAAGHDFSGNQHRARRARAFRAGGRGRSASRDRGRRRIARRRGARGDPRVGAGRSPGPRRLKTERIGATAREEPPMRNLFTLLAGATLAIWTTACWPQAGGPGFPARPVRMVVAFTPGGGTEDRKSTRLNSSHTVISYAVFCLKKKKNKTPYEHYIARSEIPAIRLCVTLVMLHASTLSSYKRLNRKDAREAEVPAPEVITITQR